MLKGFSSFIHGSLQINILFEPNMDYLFVQNIKTYSYVSLQINFVGFR